MNDFTKAIGDIQVHDLEMGECPETERERECVEWQTHEESESSKWLVFTYLKQIFINWRKE